MEDANTPIAVLIKVKTNSDDHFAFTRELRDTYERIRDEPGCISINGHQDPDDPTQFMIYELWSSAAQQNHFQTTSNYLREYLERVTPLFATPPQRHIWHEIA